VDRGPWHTTLGAVRQITDDKEEIEAMVQTYRTYNLFHHDALVKPYEGVVDEVRRLKDSGKRSAS